MLEDVWPEIGKACATGLLAGAASLAVQWMAPKAARVLRSFRASRTADAAQEPRVERRLAAILAADVVGYSRLMNADEEDTHLR